MNRNTSNSKAPQHPLPLAETAGKGLMGRACSRRSRSGRLLSQFVLLFAAALPLAAQQRPTESQVKAAYLFNFGKFVHWQANQAAGADSLEICVLGKDPFGTVLEATVAGENIEGRKITAKRLSRIQEGPECRILFVSTSEQSHLRTTLAAAQHFGMLTVSDIPHFATQGGVIEFVSQEGRIRFQVNLAAAEQSHLVLSSQLLKVASKVIASTAQNQP